MSLKEIHTESKRIIKNNFWKLFFIIILDYLIALAFTKVGDYFETTIFTAIFSIISSVITVPLSYGVIVSFMKSSNEESISIFDFINDGMKEFKRVWCVLGRTILKLILPIIVFVIAFALSIVSIAMRFSSALTGNGSSSEVLSLIAAILMLVSAIYYIVKALSYSLTSYILYENPELSAKEVVEESNLMMKGHKGSYFLLAIYTGAIYFILFEASSLIMTALANVTGAILGILVALAGAVILLPYSMGLQIAFYNLLKGTDTTERENRE